jgi:hypothetical protein
MRVKDQDVFVSFILECMQRYEFLDGIQNSTGIPFFKLKAVQNPTMHIVKHLNELGSQPDRLNVT